MDILHLVDRLEEIVKEAQRVPFSDLRLVDERRIWPLLDQMRISIPEEVRRAERVIRDKERTKAQAQEEAARVVELARQEAAQLAAEHAVVQAAKKQVAAIRERAVQEAKEIRAGADEYAFDVLCSLEEEMKRALTVIENGIRTIESRQKGSEVKPTYTAQDHASQDHASQEGEKKPTP